MINCGNYQCLQLLIKSFGKKFTKEKRKIKIAYRISSVSNFAFQDFFRHISTLEDKMSTFKEYAKRAKERMKNGFWENARQNLEHEKEVAATLGMNPCKVCEEQHQKLRRQIYDYDGFCAEEEFYSKVEAILDSDEIVSNPIMRLADQKYMAKLSPTEKQAYISKIASKYRNAVEKYRRLRS